MIYKRMQTNKQHTWTKHLCKFHELDCYNLKTYDLSLCQLTVSAIFAVFSW